MQSTPRNDGLGLCALGLGLGLACRAEPKAEPRVEAEAVAPIPAADGAEVAREVPSDTAASSDTAAPSGAATPAQPGECTAPCTPRRLHTGNSPSHLRVDSTHAYWLEEHQLLQMPRDGGPTKVMLEVPGRDRFVLDDDALFVCSRHGTTSHDVVRVPKDGSATTVLARDLRDCRTAVHGDHLYLTTDDEDRFISRVPKAGGAIERVASYERYADELASDGTHLYMRPTSYGEIFRLDPKTKTIEPFVDDHEDIRVMGFTDDHVVWIEFSNLMAAPKHGPERGKGRVLSELENALHMVGQGNTIYWASVSKASWCRMDLETDELACVDVPEGTASLAVDGSRVWWAAGADAGGVDTLDTCGCGPDDALASRPAHGVIQGPAKEDELRTGYSEDGKITVPIRDTSSDEADAIERLAIEFEGDPIPTDDPRLLPRFRVGDEYRVANGAGVFDAEIVGFTTSQGGEGTSFVLVLDVPGSNDQGGIVARPSGPPLAPMRDAPADEELARTFLPSVRKAVRSAGFRTRVKLEHLTVVKAKIPAPHEVVISVAIPDGSDDVDAGYVSALLLGDAKGSITTAVLPPDSRMESFAIDYLIDIGKDGIDEVGFTSAYYEGSYELLLQWNGSTPSYVSMGGDGS